MCEKNLLHFETPWPRLDKIRLSRLGTFHKVFTFKFYLLVSLNTTSIILLYTHPGDSHTDEKGLLIQYLFN